MSSPLNKNSSENLFLPKPSSKTYLPPSIPTSSNPKVPISRLKPNYPPAIPSTVKFEEPKKTRVEHVVIEKRYRMKITDSLNELKCMMSLDDDKKVGFFLMHYFYSQQSTLQHALLYFLSFSLLLLANKKFHLTSSNF